MYFDFQPRKNDPCPNVGHCPHAGGAAIATLVTDCCSGYAAHTTDKNQKCLAHLARTARDWQKLTNEGTFDFAFFKDVREFVNRACAFHRNTTSRRGPQADLCESACVNAGKDSPSVDVLA